MNKYKHARKGIYKPRNPNKWVQTKIIYRSSLEQKWFTYFDLNPAVISIASEKIIVPYYNEVKGRMARYYTDLVVKFKDRNGNIKIKLIEIKCSNETVKPKKPKRLTENYRQAVLTYVVNKNKWDAATKFAESKGWDFVVLTEKEL